MTTRAVADTAGVQAPTIYRLFGDKDGLLDAVAEHVMAEYVESKARTPENPDPVEGLRAGWRSQIEFSLTHPELHLLLGTRSRTSPATEAGIGVLRDRVHRIAVAGRLLVSEERAVEMIHAAGTGAIHSLLEIAPDARDHGLAEAMLDAVIGAIVAPAHTHGHARPGASVEVRAAAVTFAAFVPEMPALTPSERALLAEWVDRSIRSAQAG
ncbi:TetR family transcriptional regulator [Microbacterium sp. AG1240]|nr:TetR family transcriptional regulator [Microbacterium sp. AG1240]